MNILALAALDFMKQLRQSAPKWTFKPLIYHGSYESNTVTRKVKSGLISQTKQMSNTLAIIKEPINNYEYITTDSISALIKINIPKSLPRLISLQYHKNISDPVLSLWYFNGWKQTHPIINRKAQYKIMTDFEDLEKLYASGYKVIEPFSIAHMEKTRKHLIKYIYILPISSPENQIKKANIIIKVLEKSLDRRSLRSEHKRNSCNNLLVYFNELNKEYNDYYRSKPVLEII